MSLKVIQAVIFSINTYKQDMIVVGNDNKKLKTKTDNFIFIVCLYYHFWGEIIVYPYFIWINVLFGLMKQNNVLMSLRLDILLIHVLMLTKPPEKSGKMYV